MDSFVAINEVIDMAKSSKKECLIFKVDFEKAYDSVSWRFLDYMLIIFGFNVKCRAWIYSNVFSGNMVVIVNGSPTPEIKTQRGLKQGDPLTPFLFFPCGWRS